MLRGVENELEYLVAAQRAVEAAVGEAQH